MSAVSCSVHTVHICHSEGPIEDHVLMGIVGNLPAWGNLERIRIDRVVLQYESRIEMVISVQQKLRRSDGRGVIAQVCVQHRSDYHVLLVDLERLAPAIASSPKRDARVSVVKNKEHRRIGEFKIGVVLV